MVTPMPEYARRSGLEVLRRALRRHHPGFDVRFIEGERGDGGAVALTRQIGGSLAAPEDARAVAHRVDVAAATSGAPDHHRVDEPAEHLPPIIDREG